MSEPRLIYPLLEGFLLGDAISTHDGVRCYPALRQKTGEKYIVKVISIPASRVQLDALLLTGAFSGKDAAVHYFKELAQDIVQETQTLRFLSNQEGFVDYQDSQIIASADGNGYDVYLLGTFKRSLERILSANTMTQRGLVDLGLDLCAALAACRRAGYLYVDLKPGNIFYTDDHGYRIGDIGFVPLSSLQFTPLQNKYHSRYTAPEMADDLAVINTTLDIYALGLVLYQACNGGALPANSDAPEPPLYADYEMAEIILKACAQEPRDRWQDPTQMAQALISYLQRNEVADISLIPAPVETADEAAVEEFLPEADPEELSREMEALPAEDLQASNGIEGDTEDISEILAHADELIAHEMPEPAVAPDPIEIPMPAPIVPEPEPEIPDEPPAPQMSDTEEALEPETSDEPPAQESPVPHTEKVYPKEKRPFPWRPLLMAAAVILLLVGGFMAKHYYDHVYIQNIRDIIITQTNDTVTVEIISSIDERLLTVVCSDSYGNSHRSSVNGGIAVFTGLDPQTRYAIRVEIEGSHKLTGTTTGSFTTPTQPQILSFLAGIGPEDASVLLTLTTSGPSVECWTVTYFADGEDAQSVTFTGNNVTIYHLTVGKEYTFRLSAEGQTLGGVTETTYTATNIILAQNLTITACGGGSLTAQWSAPAGIIVTSGWAVRCHNGAGYDQTVVTYEPQYTFTGLDHTTACTIEVMAVGMRQSVSTTVGANPVTVEGYIFSVSVEAGLTIRWTYSGNAPEGGWIITYYVDNIQQEPLCVTESSASVYALPGGTYRFTIQAADGAPVFGGTAEYTLSEVGRFMGYGISAEALETQLQTDTAVLTLTADSTTAIEQSEDVIEILYILRTSDGGLLDVSSEQRVWDSLWSDNTCALSVPTMPTEAGSYTLSIYFAGGLVTEQTFTIV